VNPVPVARVQSDTFKKLASSCTILSLTGEYRQFCDAIVVCLWTTFVTYSNGMDVPT
jgi:hypothetical protein